MYQIAGAAQMKELDRQAIEEYGVSSLGLMERAAQAVAEEVHEDLQNLKPNVILDTLKSWLPGLMSFG